MRCKDTLFHPFTNIFECLFQHRQQPHPVPTSTPGLTSVGGATTKRGTACRKDENDEQKSIKRCLNKVGFAKLSVPLPSIQNTAKSAEIH